MTIKINVAGIGPFNLLQIDDENGIMMIMKDHRGIYFLRTQKEHNNEPRICTQ